MTKKAQRLSLNSHETNGQLAHRNLSIAVMHLQDMRWMLTNALESADPAMLVFDDGVAKLVAVLATIKPADNLADPGRERQRQNEEDYEPRLPASYYRGDDVAD